MLRFLFIFMVLYSANVISQNLNFLNDNSYSWPDANKYPETIHDSLLREGAVILRDDIELNFPEDYIKRRQAIKILNESGLDYFRSVTLPQNFDITRINNPVYKQGRFNKRLIPFIEEYNIIYFAARIIRNKTVYEIPTPVSTTKVYWVKKDGERIYDYAYTFSFNDLQVNDIIEYTYKSEVKGSYDTDQFYANDYFPKLKSTLSIRVAAPSEINQANMILNHHIDSLSYTRHDAAGSRTIYQTHLYKFKHLSGIKYSQNAMAGNMLPHVTASPYSVRKHYFNTTLQSSKYVYSTKYSWFIVPDSLYFKDRVYNKAGSNLRKFISTFPDNATDTSKVVFFSQVVDSINNFKFISAEQMFYGQDAQYTLASGERLLRRQLVEEYIGDLYSNILFEKNIFYYIANVQDRRFGYHSTLHRAHENYELEFIALPVNKSYKFYLPRFNGMKYFPDELPFYYEGTYCALIPKNTQAAKVKSGLQDLKFIKTPASTCNDNVRTENAVFKVNLDSLIIYASIKENLNGQFSTLLRHYYNNDCIDSTVRTGYFKRCTEKPNTTEQRIKQSSQSKTFPFRSSYNCSEKIKINANNIDLSNWFSFLFSKNDFTTSFKNNYYMDFTYTDTYNFMFEFNKPVTISNLEGLAKSISNDFFEVNVKIDKQENNKYLLCVTHKAKQYILPKENFGLVTEYVDLLEQVNSFKLNLSY